MKDKVRFLTYRFFSQPIVDFVDHIKSFLKLGSIFALILTILSFAFNETYFCLIFSLAESNICSTNAGVYLVYFILKLMVLSVFLKIWYDQVFLKKEISWIYIKKNAISFVKFFVLTVLFLFLNSIPALSFACLINREPNPFWVIELLYFTFVSLGFLVPFVLMRFYTNLAEYIEQGDFGSFKQSFTLTKDKTSKIIFSFTLLVIFCLVIFMTINGFIYRHIVLQSVLYEIFAEFCFEFALLIILTLLVNFVHTQKKYFKKDE